LALETWVQHDDGQLRGARARHWLITDQNYVAFNLINTASTLPRDAKFHTTTVITIFPFRNRPIGNEGLNFWLSLKRQWLEREGVKSQEEKKLNVSDAAVVCIGGSEEGLEQITGTPQAQQKRGEKTANPPVAPREGAFPSCQSCQFRTDQKRAQFPAMAVACSKRRSGFAGHVREWPCDD
jgi:hypothetical protein